MDGLGRKVCDAMAAVLSTCLFAAPALAVEPQTDEPAGGLEAPSVIMPRSAGWYLPNKAWTRMDAGGSWRLIADSKRRNMVGADGSYFFNGDLVAAVVNGTVPPWTYDVPERLELVDDWGSVARYLDALDVSEVRVYMVETDGYQPPQVDGIDKVGVDVTDEFDITVEGTVTKAVASKAHREAMDQRTKGRQYSMLVPFRVNFDVRADLAKDAEQRDGNDGELNICSGDDGNLVNKGGMWWENHRYWETNEPGICIVRPEFDKDVTAAVSEGGDGSSIDGRDVLLGQTLSYRLRLEVQSAADYELDTLEIRDEYDSHVTPDKSSLAASDMGEPIPVDAYEVDWDDEGHRFTLRFHKVWLDEHWDPAKDHELLLVFDAKVADDAGTGAQVVNRAHVVLNNGSLDSNEVSNTPVEPEPAKRDTQADASVDIDGRTVMVGDVLYYRVTLDATNLTGQAYPVRRLGIVDDYDEDHLRLDIAGVEVLDDGGRDVTGRFNIQDIGGVAYVFAKTVDTPAPDGSVIPGDPQPADLREYADRQLDPATGPGIDQGLLGHAYQVVLPMLVTGVPADGGIIENTAVQVTNHLRSMSNTVSNPAKDVNIMVGAESADGMSIYKGQTFLYRLDSSTLPADRAYPKMSEWRIDDDYDEHGDEPTGQWAVYAAEDLHDTDGGLLAAKSMRIAGNGFDSTHLGGDLFVLDMHDGKFVVTATQRYLDLVSADGSHAQAWRAYVQFTRVRAGEYANTFVETLNGVERPSNTVTTNTPERAPSVTVEKFDQASGPDEGDRDSTAEALELDREHEVTIVFRIINTGDVALTSLEITDETIAGDGMVKNLEYPEGCPLLVLQPGEFVDVTGTLTGVTDLHTNRAIVTAKPVVPCTPNSDDSFGDGDEEADPNRVCTDTPVESGPDDWNAYVKRMLPHTGASTGALAAVSLILVLIGLGLVQARRMRLARML